MGKYEDEHKNILTEKGFIVKLIHGVHAFTEEGREVLMEDIKKLESLNDSKK